MSKFIINPITNKKILLFSKEGRNLVTLYALRFKKRGGGDIGVGKPCKLNLFGKNCVKATKVDGKIVPVECCGSVGNKKCTVVEENRKCPEFIKPGEPCHDVLGKFGKRCEEGYSCQGPVGHRTCKPGEAESFQKYTQELNQRCRFDTTCKGNDTGGVKCCPSKMGKICRKTIEENGVNKCPLKDDEVNLEIKKFCYKKDTPGINKNIYEQCFKKNNSMCSNYTEDCGQGGYYLKPQYVKELFDKIKNITEAMYLYKSVSIDKFDTTNSGYIVYKNNDNNNSELVYIKLEGVSAEDLKQLKNSETQIPVPFFRINRKELVKPFQPGKISQFSTSKRNPIGNNFEIITEFNEDLLLQIPNDYKGFFYLSIDNKSYTNKFKVEVTDDTKNILIQIKNPMIKIVKKGVKLTNEGKVNPLNKAKKNKRLKMKDYKDQKIKELLKNKPENSEVTVAKTAANSEVAKTVATTKPETQTVATTNQAAATITNTATVATTKPETQTVATTNQAAATTNQANQAAANTEVANTEVSKTVATTKPETQTVATTNQAAATTNQANQANQAAEKAVIETTTNKQQLQQQETKQETKQ